MSSGSIAILAKAIGYPEKITPDASAYVFSVDDAQISAEESNGRLVLKRELAAADDVDIAMFAQYAAGRLLKEEAILAYDPQPDKLILWQELPAASDEDLMRRFFEVFTASCDWWQARVDGEAKAEAIPDLMIRP